MISRASVVQDSNPDRASANGVSRNRPQAGVHALGLSRPSRRKLKSTDRLHLSRSLGIETEIEKARGVLAQGPILGKIPLPPQSPIECNKPHDARARGGKRGGANRRLWDLHGKSTGVRTLGVLCLGSALAVLSIHAVTGSDESRVIQGIVTGVGFLGAGVIVRSEKGHHVQGLTTAACVWVTACLGAACAVAQWQIVVVSVVLVFIILGLGGRFEKAVDRRWPWRPTQIADKPPKFNAFP